MFFIEFAQLIVLETRTNTSKTPVRDRIFKLTPIHASMIYQIPGFGEFTEFPFHLGKTLLMSMRSFAP